MLCPSEALAAAARELGARDVRVVPSGVAIPDEVGEPDDPPHVLFVGRLSEEKGILELRRRRPLACRASSSVTARSATASPTPSASSRRVELGAYYERAAVVVCPSRREGYGVVAREAMAHGRPVVATAVGGLARCGRGRRDGPARPAARPAALRAAIETLLGDAELRRRLGARAREAVARALLVADVDARRRSTRTAPRCLNTRGTRPRPPGRFGDRMSSGASATLVALVGVPIGLVFLWLAVRNADLDAVWDSLQRGGRRARRYSRSVRSASSTPSSRTLAEDRRDARGPARPLLRDDRERDRRQQRPSRTDRRLPARALARARPREWPAARRSAP